MVTYTMDVEDKEWAQLAPLLLQNGDNAFPDNLHPYLSGAKNIFDDLHAGAAHDAHALFGAPDHGSVSIANQPRSGGEALIEPADNGLGTQVFLTGAIAGPKGSRANVPIEPTAGITGTTHRAQDGIFHNAFKPEIGNLAPLQHQQSSPQSGVPGVLNQQQQKQQVPASLPAVSAQLFATIQQQQQQTPSLIYTPQQQQPVQVNLSQLQALQQQQAFTGYQPQQVWGLQQQLWALQQQSALIAAQQQQQHGGVMMTAPTLLPMGLAIGLAPTPAANGLLHHHQQQQQQQQGGLAAVAQSPNGGPQLYGLTPAMQQAAAASTAAQFGVGAPAATNDNKRQWAGGLSDAAAAAAASPSALAAAAAAAMAAAMEYQFGKPATAAKKHRDRHRSVVGSLEAEVAEKMAQLQMLSAENEMLKLRAAVLEATVANREDQMRVISEHGPPVYPIDVPDQPPAAASSDTAASPQSSSATSGASRQHSKSAKMLAILPTELRSSASTAGEVLMQPPTPGAAAGVAAAAAEAPAGPEVGSARMDQDIDLNTNSAAAVFGTNVINIDEFWPNVQEGREVIKRMSVEDIVRHWKQFLHDVTGELVNVQKEESMLAFNSSRHAGSCAAAAAADGAAAGPECSASMQRINQLVEKYSFLIKTAQQLNPGAYCRLFGQNLDTGLPAPYSDAHWRQVVSVLGLSKQQVNHILACAELYFSCRAKLQNEQRALQQQLKSTSASTEGLLLTTAQEDSPMKPWLDRLANNLKREHVLRVMLNGFVWFKVFTPVQCAKAAVYSHPFYVDVHAMVCVMCEDALAGPGSSNQRHMVFAHRNGPAQQVVV